MAIRINGKKVMRARRYTFPVESDDMQIAISFYGFFNKKTRLFALEMPVYSLNIPDTLKGINRLAAQKEFPFQQLCQIKGSIQLKRNRELKNNNSTRLEFITRKVFLSFPNYEITNIINTYHATT